jgi:predicted Zn-dependent peptidase
MAKSSKQSKVSKATAKSAKADVKRAQADLKAAKADAKAAKALTKARQNASGDGAVLKRLPDLEPNRKLALPKMSERTLDNGLTVIAIRRPSVPLVELRLRIPFAKANLARGDVLSQALLAGTETMSEVQIAAELQQVGGALNANTDPDRLLISGNGLISGLPRLLEILADVLQGAAYPADEVTTERDRLADRIQVALNQPGHLSRVALLKKVYGSHPYAIQTPTIEQVKAVRPTVLRTLHGERLRPDGATLVLVGDLTPEKAIDSVAAALSGWTGEAKPVTLPPIPHFGGGPITVADRPTSVQSSIRVALPAVGRTHEDFPALALANLIFGGYFSSRWTENIREDKGYTYSPHSGIEHSVAGSILTLSADVATEVTAPALVETYYELGRLASLAPKEDELEQARQYAIGTLLLGMATQSGLATLASMYSGYGLRLDYLVDYSAKLAATTRDQVADAAARYLAPTKAVTVVLGDADKIDTSLSALASVERETVAAQ